MFILNMILINSNLLYRTIDIFFLIFHSSLILFNILGWICRKSRFANLITLCLTGGSWYILGIFYGPGYCPLTELHFKVLETLGERNLPDSYIRYLILRLTGADFPETIVNGVTVGAYFMVLMVSIFLNLKNFPALRNLRKLKIF